MGGIIMALVGVLVLILVIINLNRERKEKGRLGIGNQEKLSLGIRIIAGGYKVFSFFVLLAALSFIFGPSDNPRAAFAAGMPHAIITGVIAVALFIAGSGLMKLRKKALIACFPISSIIGLWSIKRMINIFQGYDYYDNPALIIMLLLLFSFHIFVIFYLLRPKVKEQFK